MVTEDQQQHGGYRHGWKRSSIKTSALHVRIKTTSHQQLRLLAQAAEMSMGEVLDKLINGDAFLAAMDERMGQALSEYASGKMGEL